MKTDEARKDTTWLSTLRGYHPQLTEKAVIDLVNGLEVVGDQLRCRRTPRPLFTRLWHAVTGRTVREQYLIDVNLTIGLEAATAWLQDLQAFQAESDLALAAVAGKLAETRTALGRSIARLDTALADALGQVHVRLDAVKRQVEELAARDKAKDQLELLLYRWEEPWHRGLPPLVQGFLAIDELWWGPFGRYCRLAHDTEATAQLLELARQKMAHRLADCLGHGTRDLMAVETLLAPVAMLADEQREVLSYLVDRGPVARVPLFQALARATNGALDLTLAPPQLPRVFSPLGLSGRLLHESRRATMEISP